MEAPMVLKLFTLSSVAAYRARTALAAIAPRKVRGLIADDRGATAIEYGLIGAGIAIAIVAIVFTVGNDISALFAAVDSKLSGKTPS
jgi:pilus assembly protein Flp/PilA